MSCINHLSVFQEKRGAVKDSFSYDLRFLLRKLYLFGAKTSILASGRLFLCGSTASYPWGPNDTPPGAVPDQSRGFGHTAPTCIQQATEDFMASTNMGAFHLASLPVKEVSVCPALF